MMKYIFGIIAFIIVTAILFSKVIDFKNPIDLGIVDPEYINEASGLAASSKNKNVLWTHNDDSPNANIIAINSKGKILGIYYLNNTIGKDWEDIAIGPGPSDGRDYIYFGDIGDNMQRFDIKNIYRFEEPVVDEEQKFMTDTIYKFDKITFKYPDKIYDSEALMIDPHTKNIYIITKRLKNEKVFKIAYPYLVGQTITAEYITDIPIGYEGMNGTGVTAGDISRDGKEILIKNYSHVYYFYRSSGETIKAALQKEP
jgi:hypothetical protein